MFAAKLWCKIQLCKMVCIKDRLFFTRSGAETHFIDNDGRTVFHLAAISQNYK